jgi:HPt (histidine-containing phosphotransfer) domain-containing protein
VTGVPSGLDLAELSRLREALSSDESPSLLAELIEVFLSETPQRIAAMRRAVRGGAAGALRMAAHALRGSSTYLGARGMAEICRALEALTEAESVDGALLLIDRLDHEFQQVKVALAVEPGGHAR